MKRWEALRKTLGIRTMRQEISIYNFMNGREPDRPIDYRFDRWREAEIKLSLKPEGER